MYLGDTVLLIKKKQIIRKESSVFQPRYEDTKWMIEGIDKSRFPFLYKLKDYPKKDRKFYSFELRKIAPSFQLAPKPTEPVVVQDVVFVNEPILRSGRVLANKRNVLYRIEKNNNIQTIPAHDLKFLKKILGEDSLIYAQTFSNPDKHKYII